MNELTTQEHEKTASHAFGCSVDSVLENLEKVASQKNNAYGQMLKIAAGTIRDLNQKKETLEKSVKVREMLDEMVNQGMLEESEVEKKASDLMEKTSSELENYEEAIKLASKAKSGNMFEDVSAGENMFSSPGRGKMFEDILFS